MFGEAVKLLAAAQEGADVERDGAARLVARTGEDAAHPAVGEPLPQHDVRARGGLAAAGRGACSREKRWRELAADDPDRAFYEGKQCSALWYARNVLPNVEQAARTMATEDASPMDIPDAAFGTAS